MGQPKKYLENFSASRVAEVTINLRSGRRFIASARDKSAFSLQARHRERTFQQPKQDIGSNGSLVSLIQHDHRIRRHVWIDQTLSLKHTIRHVLDPGFRTGAVLKTDSIPNLLAEATTNLFCDTLRDGHSCHTTRLCTSNLAPIGKTVFCKVLRHLGGLPGTSVADNDQYRMLKGYEQGVGFQSRWTYVSNCLQERVTQLVNWK